MSQVRVAKGIPNQPLLRQTRFSNSLAKQKNTKKYLRPPKKIKNTKIQLNMSKLCDGCGCGRFCRELFLLCVLQRVVVSVCVVLCGSWISSCRLHWNGCMNVAWAMLWGGSRSTKPCVFLCKVAAGDDERYLVCATGAAAVVSVANCSSYVFCNEWLCLCA